MADEQVTEVPIDQLPTIAEYKAARKAEADKVPDEPHPHPPDKQDDEGNEEEEPKEDKAVSASEEKPKGKGGFQRKIDRLIKQVADAEEKAATETKKREELEAKGSKQQEVVKEGEPQREDYASDAEFIKASVKYGVSQAIIEQAREQARLDAEEHHKEIVKKYNEATIEAKSRLDDWDEVVGQDITIPPAVGQAILRMPNGPEVAYHLGKNPKLAAELMEMDDEEARGAVWVISRELAGAKPKQEAKEVEEKAKKPKPITPVGSSGNGHTTVPLDKMDIASYKKARSTGRVQ